MHKLKDSYQSSLSAAAVGQGHALRSCCRRVLLLGALPACSMSPCPRTWCRAKTAAASTCKVQPPEGRRLRLHAEGRAGRRAGDGRLSQAGRDREPDGRGQHRPGPGLREPDLVEEPQAHRRRRRRRPEPAVRLDHRRPASPPRSPPRCNGGNNGGGNQIQFVATGPEYADLARWLQPILRAAQQNPGLASPAAEL